MIPKFRAWNKKLKKMMQVLDINLDPEFGGVFVWGKVYHDHDTGEQEADKDFWPWQDIELMQHTGQNDTKIYEDDILALKGEKLPYKVYWNYDRWGLKDYRNDDYDSGDYYRGDDINNWHEWEVIGNAWEHPELLEKHE